MKSGSSACISSAAHSSPTLANSSSSMRSRPCVHGTLAPVRFTTRTLSMPPTFLMASSALALSGTFRPPRRPSSAVIRNSRLAIVDAAGERIRREATEHDRMDGADARASEHGVSGFRNHGQVDGDAVAALDAVRLEHVGEAADLSVQLAIGDVARFLRWIVRLPDDGDLLAALLQMAVDAVGGDVEGSVLEPSDRDIGIGKRGVLDARVGLDPVEALAFLAPELVRLLDASAVELLVFVLVDERALLPRLGNLHGLDFVRLVLGHSLAPDANCID